MRLQVFIFFILFIQNLTAQVSRKNIKTDFLKEGYFGAHAGIAIPFGSFASVDNDADKSSGFANTGYTFNLFYHYSISQTIGLSFQYFYTSNPFDSKKFQDYLDNKNAPYSYQYRSDPWTIQGLMIAPVYMLNADKLSLDLSAGIGFLSAILPETEFTEIQSPTFKNTYLQPEVRSFDLGFSFGIGMRYKLFKDLILRAQGEALISNQKFSGINLQTAAGGFIIAQPDYTQPFRIFQLTAGIGYQFD